MLELPKHPFARAPYLEEESTNRILAAFGTRADEFREWVYQFRAVPIPLKMIFDGIARGFSDGMRDERQRHIDPNAMLTAIAGRASELRTAIVDLAEAGAYVEFVLAWGGDAQGLEPLKLRIREVEAQVSAIQQAANSGKQMRASYTPKQPREAGGQSNLVLERTIDRLCWLFVDLNGSPPTGSRKRGGRKAAPVDAISMAGTGGVFVAAFFRELRRVDPQGVRNAGVTASTLEAQIRRWRALYARLPLAQ